VPLTPHTHNNNNSSLIPLLLLIADYCSRGSLYDVLRQAAKDPTAARQLTWLRRLALVSLFGLNFARLWPAAGPGRSGGLQL